MTSENRFVQHLPRLESNDILRDTLVVLQEFVNAFTMLDLPAGVRVSIETDLITESEWRLLVVLTSGSYTTNVVKVNGDFKGYPLYLKYRRPTSVYDLRADTHEALIKGLKEALQEPWLKRRLEVLFDLAR